MGQVAGILSILVFPEYSSFSSRKKYIYRQTSNISRTLGNKIAVHSDLVGASPVGAAPTTSSFSN